MPSKESKTSKTEAVAEKNDSQPNPTQDGSPNEGISKPNSIITPPTTTAPTSPKKKKPWAGF